MPYGTLATGIPLFYGPDVSSGVVDLPRQRRHGLALRRPRQPRLHPVLEPDLRAPAARGTCRCPRATWAPRRRTSSASSTSTRRVRARGRPASRSTSSGGARPSRARFDGWLELQLPLAAGGPQQALQQGALREGGLHLLEGHEPPDDDGWSNVDWNSPDLLYKNYGPAGYDRAHIFQLGFLAELPFGKNGSGVAQRDRQELVAQRRRRRLHRDPVHRHGLGRLGQRPGESADGRPRGDHQQDRRDRRRTTPTTTRARGRRSRRSASATRAATRCAGRDGGTSTCRSSAGSRSGRSSPWRPASRPST